MENQANRSTEEVNNDNSEGVRASMGFARRSAEEESFPAGGIPKVSRDVTVRNARQILSCLSLDREGFTLVRHKTAFANERDPMIVRDQYLNEMAPFIKDYFNASWVVPNSAFSTFVRRSGLPVVSGADVTATAGLKVPAPGVHIDYMRIAAPMLAARQNQLLQIPIRSYSRLMIINTWRAISPPPQDAPLAVCDSSSVSDTDIAVFDYADADSGTAYKTGLGHYSPLHRWYYFPDMTPDELILIKGYDSEQNFRVLHAAFDNRCTYPNAKPRESLEARFFVYYD